MLVTPFDEQGRIDMPSLDNLVDFTLRAKTNGISILGLGGEAPELTVRERLDVMEAVAAHVAGSAPLLVGCTAERTRTAVRLAEAAAAIGATAIVVAPPRRPEWSRNELIRHFVTVARCVEPLPVMIQDAPSFIGVSLDAILIRAVADVATNVRHAKPEGLPAALRAAELVEAGVSVFGGHGGLYTLDVLDAGGIGLIPGCEAPGMLTSIVNAYVSGDTGSARSQFSQLLPLLAYQFQGLDFFVACVKQLLVELGVIARPELRRTPDPLRSVGRRLLHERARAAGVLPDA